MNSTFSATDEIALYEAAGPDALPEQWASPAGDRIVRNVVVPTLTPVHPDPSRATGAGVMVMPGGGFRLLAIDNEGFAAAHWLAERGVAAFVLKYRTTVTPRDGMPQMPGKGDRTVGLPPEGTDALQDAWTALGRVRNGAAQFRIDPTRVGVLGFSAGAMLALELALGQAREPRPAFAGLVYGPLDARPVPADAPATFAVLAADDPFFESFALVQGYRDAGRPVEFHLYGKGGHAFGMRKQGSSSDLWPEEFLAWMAARGLLK